MSDYMCVCELEVCVSVCDWHEGVVLVMGLLAILSKVVQLPPQLYSAEHCCTFSNLFIIFSLFTYLCFMS